MSKKEQFATIESVTAYAAGFCALAVVYCELQILSRLLDEKGIVSLAECESKKPIAQEEFQEVVNSMKKIVRSKMLTNPQKHPN
ncbi:MAG: hypothetical protein ACRD4S_01650 [Candidatus Acidiferrales bacterium]